MQVFRAQATVEQIVDTLLEAEIAPSAAPPAQVFPARLSENGPSLKTLKDNRTELDDDERKLVMRSGAVWHFGKEGKPTPAVWKSVVRGKTWFVCNTHRAYRVKASLKAAIRAFDYIETTA